MSIFLGTESPLIALGASIMDVQNTMKTAFTTRGWQIVEEALNPTAFIGTLFTVTTNPLTGAFNQSASDSAASTAALPLWIGFQAPSPFTPTEVRIVGSNTATYSPKDFTIDYSDNGTSWTTLTTITNEVNWIINETRKYAITGAAAHAYWRINVTAKNTGSYVEMMEIRFKNASNQIISNNNFLYMIPPSTETIGSAQARDVVLMSIGSNFISVTPVMEAINPYPPVIAIWEKTAGAVACGVTLSTGTPFAVTGSVSASTLTVTFTAGVLGPGSPVAGNGIPPGSYIASNGTGTGGNGTYFLNVAIGTIASESMIAQAISTVTGAAGSAGSTAKQNLRALYDAIRTSSDTNFTRFNWFYNRPPAQNAQDTNDYIIGIMATAAPNVQVTPASTTNAYLIGNYSTTGIQATLIQPTTTIANSLTTDLVNGFVYYLQISSRGFALAIKTNTNFYGPIHACYGDHAEAVAAMPITLDIRHITPIELIVGVDASSLNSNSNAIASHSWMIQTNTDVLGAGYGYAAGHAEHPFSCHQIRNVFHDGRSWQYGFNYASTTIALDGSGLFSGADAVGDDFQIHREQMQTTWISGASDSDGGYHDGVVPILKTMDWYKFVGTATNESLLLVADTVIFTQLNQAMDNTTAYTIITLIDTSTLAPAGYIVIDGEIIQYTGISGLTITGCTRAKYGTAMQNHYVGENAYQGLWFTVINGGAIFNGYTKPV